MITLETLQSIMNSVEKQEFSCRESLIEELLLKYEKSPIIWDDEIEQHVQVLLDFYERIHILIEQNKKRVRKGFIADRGFAFEQFKGLIGILKELDLYQVDISNFDFLKSVQNRISVDCLYQWTLQKSGVDTSKELEKVSQKVYSYEKNLEQIIRNLEEKEGE